MRNRAAHAVRDALAISITISGAVFALVYLRRRSALEAMVAHGFSDVLAVLAATMLAVR